MKKLILLLIAAPVSLSLSAQESNKSIVFSAGQPQDIKEIPALPASYRNGLRAKSNQNHSPNTANKTTTATGRWYNYGQYLDTTEQMVSGTTALAATIIWNDTSGMVNYSCTQYHGLRGSHFSPTDSWLQ